MPLKTRNYSSMKPIIFLSSTFEDLKEYRQEVIELLQSMQCEVSGMEFFGARTEAPLEVCLSEVEKSNIYIGILGMRYGFVDEESNRSYTHLEYEKATNHKLERLIFLIDENNQPVLPKNVDIGEKGILLRDFKNELKRKHTVVFFTTPEHLVKKVRTTLELKLDDINALKTPTDKGESLTIDSQRINTRIILGGVREEDENFSFELNEKTNFYLHYETQDQEASIVVYLRFKTDLNEEKWIAFGTVRSIKNKFKSEHVYRIGYPSMTQKTIKENILDKISESGLELSGKPIEILRIRFRNDADLDNSVRIDYGYEEK